MDVLNVKSVQICDILRRYTWGCNALGQLGLGHTAHRIAPVPPPNYIPVMCNSR